MKALLHFARSYPWQSFVVLLCLAVAGLLEGLGLTALLPLLGTVSGEAPGESTTDLELRVRAVFERVGERGTPGLIVRSGSGLDSVANAGAAPRRGPPRGMSPM
jgi:hypothetical protein